MKKITTSLLAIALVIGLSSCKENTTSETVDEVTTEGHSHDEHGMHDHDKNDNDGHSHDADGNHVHDDKAMEGKLAVAMGSKSGSDIGNLVANDEGAATLEFSTDKWCIGCDDETKNIIGKAFIVHASADDFESQPSGAAGARVACGVIK